MANTWFTSDFHFGHFNITRYCNLHFTTTEEMDASIEDRIDQRMTEQRTDLKLPDDQNSSMAGWL
jgi:calcineurin-like phosphoesterase family protein